VIWSLKRANNSGVVWQGNLKQDGPENHDWSDATQMKPVQMIFAGLGALALSGLVAVDAVLAEPTDVTVRVLSKGAKFVGSSMGGVEITLRDANTGELLAQGATIGGTGSTEKIMKSAHERGAPVSTEDSAKFTTTLDLETPRLVRVEAYGPMSQRQSAVTVTSTQWVVPGKDVTGGDAWLLELPGFVVDVVAPQTPLKAGDAPQTLTLTANVFMMCGCPITPDGLWDANAYEIEAMVMRDGKLLRTVPLGYAGKASQFTTELEIAEPGAYEAIVYAYDPANGSTGLDRASFSVD